MRRQSVQELYLQSIPLAVIVNEEEPFIDIKTTINVEEALKTLCVHKMQMCPVYDEETKSYPYVCSRLDMIGILSWSVSDGWGKGSLVELLESEEHVVDPRLWKFRMNDHVIDLLEPFSKGVHHILVENDEYVKDGTQNEEFDEKPNYFVSQC